MLPSLHHQHHQKSISSAHQHLPPQRASRSRSSPCRRLLLSPPCAAAATVDARGLSYLGDAIWTLCVRRHFFAPPKHWRTYQDVVQPYVTAEGQARMYDTLLSGAAGATHAEQQLLRAVRATAAGWRLRKRFATPAAAEAYHKATAFEALVGHLHLTDPERLVLLADGLMEQQQLLQQQSTAAAQGSATSPPG